jgi:hypothetical protein
LLAAGGVSGALGRGWAARFRDGGGRSVAAIFAGAGRAVAAIFAGAGRAVAGGVDSGGGSLRSTLNSCRD